MESYTDILRGHERSGCGLKTISFLTIVEKVGIRRCGMCSVCLTDEDGKTGCKFCQCSECECKDRTDRQFNVTGNS
jgi:hypothetical protein